MRSPGSGSLRSFPPAGQAELFRSRGIGHGGEQMPSRCGYIKEPHDPHEYGSTGRQCSGLTQDDIDVEELTSAIREFRRDHPDSLPEGSRLLCHATVHITLIRQFHGGVADYLGKVYSLPLCVVPSPGMQAGEWMVLTNEQLVRRGVMKGAGRGDDSRAGGH